MNQFKNVPVAAVENLGHIVTRVRGILYLLAAKASDDERIYNPPTREEAEGITWLAMMVGEELTGALEVVESAPKFSTEGAES